MSRLHHRPPQVSDDQLMEQVSRDEILASLVPRCSTPRQSPGTMAFPGGPSSWSDASGTCLTSRTRRPIGRNGLELGSPVDRVEELHQRPDRALHIPDQPGIAARLFEAPSAAAINVDLIIRPPTRAAAMTSPSRSLKPISSRPAVSRGVLTAWGELAAEAYDCSRSVGPIMPSGHRGTAVQLPEPTGHLRLIATSEAKVSCVIGSSHGKNALQAMARPSRRPTRRFS